MFKKKSKLPEIPEKLKIAVLIAIGSALVRGAVVSHLLKSRPGQNDLPAMGRSQGSLRRGRPWKAASRQSNNTHTSPTHTSPAICPQCCAVVGNNWGSSK